MDDESGFEEYEDVYEIQPQRFSKIVLLRAGLDFAGHVLEGARCALGIIEAAVIGHEVFQHEQKAFHEEMTWDLDMIPETDEPT